MEINKTDDVKKRRRELREKIFSLEGKSRFLRAEEHSISRERLFALRAHDHNSDHPAVATLEKEELALSRQAWDIENQLEKHRIELLDLQRECEHPGARIEASGNRSDSLCCPYCGKEDHWRD